MKICELKINNCYDRAKLVGILAFAGYKVSIDERKKDHYFDSDYYVVVEDKESEG